MGAGGFYLGLGNSGFLQGVEKTIFSTEDSAVVKFIFINSEIKRKTFFY